MIKATHTGEVRLGNILIPCFVLENEARVISDSGLVKSLDMKGRGRKIGGHRIVAIFDDMKANFLLNNNFSAVITNPTKFEYHGKIYHGHSTETFTELLSLFSKAGRMNLAKTDAQKRYIRTVENFRDALVNVALDALVDEATGYQDVRSKHALADILNRYVAERERPWIKTFPLEFYKQIFRLRGWHWQDLPNNKKPHTPSVVGKDTREIIYKRIIPGLPEELLAMLDELNPVTSSGNRKGHHHRWFDEENGLPELKRHLNEVIGIMKASANWSIFIDNLQSAYPVAGDQLKLNFSDD